MTHNDWYKSMNKAEEKAKLVWNLVGWTYFYETCISSNLFGGDFNSIFNANFEQMVYLIQRKNICG